MWVMAPVLDRADTEHAFTIDGPITSPCCPLLHGTILVSANNICCLDKYNGLLVDLVSSNFLHDIKRVLTAPQIMPLLCLIAQGPHDAPQEKQVLRGEQGLTRALTPSPFI